MLIVARIFQVVQLCAIFTSLIFTKKVRGSAFRVVKISNWVFYLCGIMSFSLSFGITAILEEHATEQYSICFLFVIACIICAVIMIVQKTWQIKYNEEVLVFRNAIGLTREFILSELVVCEGNRTTRILHNNKDVATWDSLLMNTEEEIALIKTIEKKRFSNKRNFT